MAGSLKWDETEKTVRVPLGQEKAETEFRFTNVSGKPVKIEAVRTSCGCLTSEMPKQPYQPGASGGIKVVFTVGKMRGKQQKLLIVKAADSFDLLKLTAEIEDPVKMSKGRLNWKVGAPAESQAFEITLSEGTIDHIASAGDGFEASLEKDGKNGRVTVKPRRTDIPGKTSLLIQVSDPAPRLISVPLAVE